MEKLKIIKITKLGGTSNVFDLTVDTTHNFFVGKREVLTSNCDGLSLDAQRCLRNIIEEYASCTRFILTGNYKHKIIPALQSRTQYFDLTPPLHGMGKKLFDILAAENIIVDTVQKPGLIQLLRDSYPDIRKAINAIQKYSVTGSLIVPEMSRVDSVIYKIDEFISNKKVLDLRKYLIENEVSFQGDYDNLLKQYLNSTYKSKKPDDFKRQVVIIVSEYLYRATLVADKEINSFACFIAIEKIVND